MQDVLVAVTDEYRYVVSAGLDHKIYLWDAISGELKGERTDSDSAFSCLAFDASNNLLLAATYHFSIVVWDISCKHIRCRVVKQFISATACSCLVRGPIRSSGQPPQPSSIGRCTGLLATLALS